MSGRDKMKPDDVPGMLARFLSRLALWALRSGMSAIYGIIVISAILVYMFRRKEGGSGQRHSPPPGRWGQL